MKRLMNRRLMNRKFFLILGISFLILMAGVFFTEGAQAVKGKVYTTNGRYYKKEGYFIFKDNPRMEYKDYIITADTIEYYENDEKAIFTGNVMVIEGETKLSAEKMNANLNKDEFIFEKGVKIYYVRKSKEQAETQSNEGNNDIIEILAEHVKYLSGDNDHLIATGQVVMDVEDDNIKSDYLEYIGSEEKVLARGNVQVLGKDEEKISCEDFIYLLEGEEEGFVANGNVTLEFTIDEEEANSSEEVQSTTEADNAEDVPQTSVNENDGKASQSEEGDDKVINETQEVSSEESMEENPEDSSEK